MIVPSSKLGWVTLDRVVKVNAGTGPSSVDRTNRQRQVTLLANTKPGGSAASITSAIDSYVKELNLPSGYRTGYVGQSKEMGKAGFYFLLAFMLSFIFMYIVLAAQFESFIHPVTILLTLPLSIPFGIFSLLVTGQTVNIFSGLGLLLLFGVVKKNAILQIDHTNNLRSQGHEPLRRDHPGEPRPSASDPDDDDRTRRRHDAAGRFDRCRVRVLTARSACSSSAASRLCLLLTLLAVPVFYSVFDDLAELKIFQALNRAAAWIFGGAKRRLAGAASSIFGTQAN